MALLEAVFLIAFWVLVVVAAWFLRTTLLPNHRPAITVPSSLPLETVTFHATDGQRLAGSKLCVNPSAPWIILCHGLGTSRHDLLDIAAALAGAGFNLFLFDFRGHGQSQGRVTSFGWQEQRDVEGALAFLGRQPDATDRPYGIFGLSMGGVVAIMVAARDERLGAVAADSPYTDLHDSLGRHLKFLYGLPAMPFLFIVSSTYRIRFGVWPSQMTPQRQIGRISPRALLLIHGEQDLRTPVQDAKRLAELAGEPKQLVIVPGAVHLGAFQLDPLGYQRRLIEFFQNHLAA